MNPIQKLKVILSLKLFLNLKLLYPKGLRPKFTNPRREREPSNFSN